MSPPGGAEGFQCPVCPQSTVMDFPNGVAELDSDMADITSFQTGGVLGGEDDGDVPGSVSGKLAGQGSAEEDGLSVSSHIACSLGINPHTLQVGPAHTKEARPLTGPPPANPGVFCVKIMKASLFAGDEEDSDPFQGPGAMKVSADVSSPRVVLPGAQGRPSGGAVFCALLTPAYVSVYTENDQSCRVITVITVLWGRRWSRSSGCCDWRLWWL